MASFLEKLKKGMDIKESDIEIEKEKEPEEEPEEEEEEEITPVSFTPKEITTEEMEEKLNESAPKGVYTAAAKSSASSLIKEVKKKKKPIKKIKEEIGNIKIKELDDDLPKISMPKSEKWLETEGQLVIDVYETDDEIVVQSAIAGVNPEDLDISIENDMVSIKGKREQMFERKEKNYFHSECYWGYFSREIILPKEVDAKRADASMKNGVLTIRMPKIERERKRISVK